MPTPLDQMPPAPPRAREIFANRTLNMRGIGAIGFDMDYTLIHYHVDVWERRAYEYTRDRLASHGFPVEGLTFDPSLVARGLVIDTHLGNIVKADRFGYVKAAAHGSRPLEFRELKELYQRTFVDLRDERWVFMSTLFDISAGCLVTQLVDMLDAEPSLLPKRLGYRELFELIKVNLDAAHIEGRLKAEIIADPERFVVLDPEAAEALLDLRAAGKRLIVITNSEWHYTRAMMAFAFDRYLPGDMTWRDVFDMVVVSARKPVFFAERQAMFEIVDESTGQLLPLSGLPQLNGLYYGGHAAQIEAALGLSGADILYVGDHVYSDVNVSKQTVRWRTALVLRELEDELAAIDGFAADDLEIARLMADKIELERHACQLRLDLKRCATNGQRIFDASRAAVVRALEDVKARMQALDERIAPIAERSSHLVNYRWGPLMRAGIDKSHMARQIERYADIYTSRVSNFLYATPTAYVRAPKNTLPHDH